MPAPVVVIGAGLAGLTAAAKLARAHVPVVVLESSPAPGGRARTTERDGYLLNLGPHALATKGPGSAVLKDLGIDLPGRSPTIMGARFLRDGEVDHAAARRSGGAGLRLLPGLSRLARSASAAEPGTTVADLLDGVSGDPPTRVMVGAIARLMTYADAFDTQSAGVIGEVAGGGRVRYLDGGWGALVGRLRAIVEAAGGQVRSGAPVRRIEGTGDGRVRAVRLDDGAEVAASAVIVASGGPRDVAALLDGESREHLAAWVRDAAPVRLACLDVALRRRPDVPAIVLGVDQPLYLSVHSDRSRLAPAGGAVVQLARFLDVGMRAPEGTRDELEGLLDGLDPRWRSEVVHVRYLPDLVVTHDAVLATRGGIRHRPGPEVPGVSGLYVAGDWVGPRGYLAQATLASAGTAAALAGAYARGRSTGWQPIRAEADV